MGNAKTEEESSLVGEADLHSNLLPAGEKVEVREAREAGKGNEAGEGKKKLEKKKKQKLREKGRKGTKEKGNKKNIKEERAEKRKNSRKLKKGKNTDAKGKKKGKKNKKTAKKRNNKKAKGKKKKTKADKKKKKRTRKDKKQAKKEKKEKKKAKKDKKRRRKNKLKNAKKTLSGARQGPAGGDWSSCGTSGVNDTCLLNAVNSLNFEKNQIQNFFKQKARLENQDKVTGNKKGKKGEFEDAAGYMLTAIGGNISSPSCGENSTRAQRAAADAVTTYNTLINCSETIHEACDMPNGTINGTFNANCADIYNKSKIASDDCRSNTAYTNNGSAACNCWEKAAIGIVIAKAEGCTKKGKEITRMPRAKTRRKRQTGKRSQRQPRRKRKTKNGQGKKKKI